VARMFTLPRVGSALFVVVMLLVSIALGIILTETQFRSSNEYHAELADSSGLKVDEEVRVAGIRVGAVVAKELTPQHTVIVTFTVASDQLLTGGTRALVRLKNLTGDHFLQLAPGPGPPQLLAPGGMIPISHTAPAIDLNVLLAGFRPLIQALNPDQVNQLASSLIAVLQGQSGTVQELLGNVGSLTNTLADRDAVIGRVVDNVNGVLRTLDDHDQNLVSLIDNLQQVVSGLAQDRGVIGQSLVGINQLTSTTTGLLQEARPPLRGDIVQLGRLADVLNKNQQTLDMVLGKLPQTYRLLDRIGSNGSFFNFYICDLQLRITGPTGQDEIVPASPLTSGRPRCDAK
jgi:phospholipid/cholesterol/gamma-HCH transport system substrate-binding protein